MNDKVWICSKCGKQVTRHEGDTPPPQAGCNEAADSTVALPGNSLHDWQEGQSETNPSMTAQSNWRCRKCRKTVPAPDPTVKPSPKGCPERPSPTDPPGESHHYWLLEGDEGLNADDRQDSGWMGLAVDHAGNEDWPNGEPNWRCRKCGTTNTNAPTVRPAAKGCPKPPSAGDPAGESLHDWWAKGSPDK